MSYDCQFTYDFRPVGQGLFCRGELVFIERGNERRRFQWVYDCGSENGAAMRGEIDLYRRQLPEPQKLDLVVLSHFDDDHVKGVGRLLRGLRVDHLVLPYLTPGQRMWLAARDGGDDFDYIRFLIDPATYLLTLPGADIGTITFIQSGQEPLPPDEVPGNEPPPRDRPGVYLKGAHPSRDEFHDDPAMLSADNAVASRVQVSRCWRPMDVFGLWEFAFYNLPRPDVEGQLRQEVQPVFERFYRLPEAQRNYDTLIGDLRRIFRQSHFFGASESGRNDISLVTYSGPVTQRLRSAHYVCRNHCQYPASREGRGPHAGREEVCDEGRVSVLYTGDLAFDAGVTRVIRRFLGEERWGRIRFLQVPHHGSRHSWQVGDAANWPHDWSVFSAGLNNKYQHPHTEVLDDLRQRNPILVNETTGAAWGGLVGWGG